jgi:hypothetical protein
MSFLLTNPMERKPFIPKKRLRPKPGFDEDGFPLPIPDPKGYGKPSCPFGFIINNDFSIWDPINPPWRCKEDQSPEIDYEKAAQIQFKVQEPISPVVETVEQFAPETQRISVDDIKADSQKNVIESNKQAAKRQKQFGFSGGTRKCRSKRMHMRNRSRKRSKSSAKSKRCRSGCRCRSKRTV